VGNGGCANATPRRRIRGQGLNQSAGGRGRLPGRGPHPIDVHVGARVRLRRNMRGLSQTQLAEALGLTFQQVQKYERGANRIGASRLLEVARFLDVPINFFYDDTDPVRAPALPSLADRVNEPAAGDPLQSPETLDLVTAYFRVDDPKTRWCLLELARALASSEAGAISIRRRRGPARPRVRALPSVTQTTTPEPT